MHRGFVKVWRKSIDNPLFKKPLVWHYFQYCLLKANHKDTRTVFNCKEITVEKGCFITGRKVASKETGLSEQEIRTAIKTLVNLKMIQKSTSESTNRFTLIKVMKFDSYHDQEKVANQSINQPATNQQPTSNQPATTSKECKRTNKNVKNDKKKDLYERERFRIIDYLNKKTGQNLNSNSKDAKFQINGRLNQNYKEIDFKIVIDKKCREWLGTERQNYLRPATLFCEKHFDQYLNALEPVNQSSQRKQSTDDYNMEFLNDIGEQLKCKQPQIK